MDCEDLRDGCSALVDSDGWNGNYSYIDIATTPDAVLGPGASFRRSSSLTACTARQTISFSVRRFRGHAITRVKVFVDGRLAARFRGWSLRSIRLPGIPGTARHRIRLYEYTRARLVRRVTRTMSGCN